MSRIFKGSKSTLRLLISKTSEYKTLTNLKIKLYTTNIEHAIEVIDGIDIENDIATIYLAPRAFLDMEEGVINYIIDGEVDGKPYHTERQSNYYLKNLSYISEDGIASSTIDITENGTYKVTPNDGLYVDINVNVEDSDGSYDEGYNKGKTDGFGEGYVEGRTEGITEGFAEGREAGYVGGKTEGIAEQKGKLTSIDITQNGEYTKEDGYNRVNVNVPQARLENEITVKLNAGSTGTITPSAGYDAMKMVNYTVSGGGGGETTGKKVIPNGMIFSSSTFTSFDGTNWDFSKVYDGINMFTDCTAMTEVTLTDLKPVSMASMFLRCNKLTTINGLNTWDTSKNTSLRSTFSQNHNLVDVTDIQNMNTSKVNDMYCTFYNCSGLTSIDLSNWDVSNVTTFRSMFSGCKNLKSIDISGWQPSSATELYGMFSGCSVLTGSIDISGWNMPKLTTTQGMFHGCSGLTEIDMSNCYMPNNSSLQSMFYNCSKLKTINTDGTVVKGPTTCQYMFYGCTTLTSVDLSAWDLSNVTQFGSMFYRCNSLTSITFGGPVNPTTVSSMFTSVKSGGTFYYPAEYADTYTKILNALPSTWSKVQY